MTTEDLSAEPPPQAARDMFGRRFPLALRYADWLAGPGVERGLLGPRERQRLWSRHLLNSAAVTELIPSGARVADVGSGAGLPGMVVALRRPDLQVTLVEPLLRRSTFLSEVVADLGLGDSVEVRRARAEELAGKRTFGVVTARAVAPLERLAGWCLPLVSPGGLLLALKGSSAPEELVAAGTVLERWQVDAAEVVQVGDRAEPTWVVRVVASTEAGSSRQAAPRGARTAGRTRHMRGSDDRSGR